MAKRQQFTTEFKVEAVRLWKPSDPPAAAVARELVLRRNHLYKWQATFPGKGGRAHSMDEPTRLQRENARLREERDIFKKAAMYFAKELHKVSVRRCASGGAPAQYGGLWRMMYRGRERGSARVTFTRPCSICGESVIGCGKQQVED